MAKRAFDMMMEGLDDAITYVNGDDSRGRAVSIPDVKAIREKTHLSQVQFAKAMRIKVATLRDWEQHRRSPDGPARTLLGMVDAEPETTLRLIAKVAA